MFNLKKIGSELALIATVMFTCLVSAKTCPEIQFLDTYDQLATVIGQEGHWFVRDAANTKTEQHGDPTVGKGWAIYTWDGTLSCWHKICEEESLDNSVTEALLRQYVKTATFEAAMAVLTNKYTTIEAHNQAVLQLNNKIVANQRAIANVETVVNGMKSKLDTTADDATYAKQQVISIREKVSQIESKEDDLKDEMISRDSEVLRLANKYTDEHGGGGGGSCNTNRWRRIAEIQKPVKEIVTVNQLYDILMRIIDIAGETSLASPKSK